MSERFIYQKTQILKSLKIKMPDTILSKKVIALTILALLLVLAFLILKPFFTAIVLGFILAYILQWPYKQLKRIIKKSGVAAGIICFIFVVILAFGLYFVAQIAIKEAFNLYLNVGKIDILSLINKIVQILFPNSSEISNQISTTIQVGITDLVNSFIQGARKLISDMPQLIAQFFITFLIAFYGLKDNEKILGYIKDILPFESEITDKFVKKSKDVVFATIYGQIVVGIVQGITAGIGFYIFKAQSPLLMTLLAIFFAILPLLGAWVIWIPIAVSMIATGNLMGGILMIIYGLLVVGTIDNIVRPFVVGKKSSINPAVIFLGMVGGLVLMGPVGMIAGPIILEYTLLFIELYRKGNLRARA